MQVLTIRGQTTQMFVPLTNLNHRSLHPPLTAAIHFRPSCLEISSYSALFVYCFDSCGPT